MQCTVLSLSFSSLASFCLSLKCARREREHTHTELKKKRFKEDEEQRRKDYYGARLLISTRRERTHTRKVRFCAKRFIYINISLVNPFVSPRNVLTSFRFCVSFQDDARAKQALALAQQQQGGQGIDLTNAPTSAQEQSERLNQEQQLEDERQAFLASVLEPNARERLARVKLVKPSKAQGVERMILNASRQGKLGKVSEQMLIDMLNTVSESGIGEKKVGSITFERKKSAFDEEDESEDEW
jgi:programmed cell death protein 5